MASATILSMMSCELDGNNKMAIFDVSASEIWALSCWLNMSWHLNNGFIQRMF
jgi:hypothetical protein